MQGVVYRILWDRIFLRLPDGAHGVVRRREFSWEPEPQVPRHIAKLDEVVDAVVLAVDPETRGVDLSLRFAERDPWQDLLKRLPVGTVFDTPVLQVRDFGTFVEIEAGVEGFIPAERHGDSARGLSEPLWPEDIVRVVVKEIDIQRRHIWLQRHVSHSGDASKEVSHRQSGSARLGDFLDQTTMRRLLQTVGDLPPAVNWPIPDRILSILIADDDADFKGALADLLRDVGYTVHVASTASEALSQIAATPCDLAILDLSLSIDEPLLLARRAQSACPGLHVLLLSGFEVDESVKLQADELGFRLESKPLGPRALAEVLRRFESGEFSAGRNFPPTSPPAKKQAVSYSTSDIRELMRQACYNAGADYAIIFENDPQRPSRVLWPYCAGIELTDSEDLHTTLLYSPVGEVLRDRRMVTIADTRKMPRRVTYLTRATPFSSCVGMPIEILSRDQPYAFFAFSRKAHAFSEGRLRGLSTICRELGQMLFRQHEFDRFLGLQEELLQSRLRAGALHDIRNTLGSMAFKLNSLENLLGRSPKEPKAVLDTALSHVLSIQTFVDQMEKTTSLLRELAGDNLATPLDINALVHRLVERQRLLASHLSVTLSFEPDLRLPVSVLRSAHLQQVVDNIILNALQWCQGRKLKQAEVRTQYDSAAPSLPIKVRVSDTGPGIHRRLQSKKIFELGFSRREGGSGLGLFVSRALIETMGGTVSVEHSIMDVGTTFLISLPQVRANQAHLAPQ